MSNANYLFLLTIDERNFSPERFERELQAWTEAQFEIVVLEHKPLILFVADTRNQVNAIADKHGRVAWVRTMQHRIHTMLTNSFELPVHAFKLTSILDVKQRAPTAQAGTQFTTLRNSDDKIDRISAMIMLDPPDVMRILRGEVLSVGTPDFNRDEFATQVDWRIHIMTTDTKATLHSVFDFTNPKSKH